MGCVFAKLASAMKKYHLFEYTRQRKSMVLQFLVFFLSQAVIVMMSFIRVRIFSICNDPSTIGNGLGDELLFANGLSYILNVETLFLCFNIAVIKNSADVLQGISKLDYLMIASIFQKQKPSIR
mmetsp:Transcript_1590/g.2115  ORF Transcript_1590/g.2115 Transcript_1590/m.2115 type:complete len:124 (-) Transcript_1590:59-430(-)